MPGLIMDPVVRGNLAARPRAVPVFQTLLAGDFAVPGCLGRLLLEFQLKAPVPGRAHHVLPGVAQGCPIAQAETQLAGGGIDIVLLDLNGSVAAMLSLVARARAAAGEGVIFIGILAAHAGEPARRYLPAVVDAMVDGPLLANSLHSAIADALQAASDYSDSLCGVSEEISDMHRH